MKKLEYDLPLERFHGSVGWETRIDGVSAFKCLSSAEKLVYCITKGYDLYTSMAKCKVSFGAMTSFKNAYEYFTQQQRQDTEKLNAQIEKRFQLKFFPNPEECSLDEHVYYLDTESGNLLTTEEYQTKIEELKKENILCLKS